MRLFNKKTARSLVMAGILSSGVTLAEEGIDAFSPQIAAALGPALYCTNGATPGTRTSIKFCDIMILASAACNEDVKAQLIPNIPEQKRSLFLTQVEAAQNYYTNHTPGNLATCLTTIVHGFINAQVYEANQTI